MTPEREKLLQEAYARNCKALLVDPDDPAELADRYALLSVATRSPMQIMISKRCMECAPNEFIAIFNYASALSRNGRPSISWYKKALAVAPPERMALTLHHLGLAYHDLQEYEKALEYFEKAGELDPTLPTLGQSIAVAKMSMGNLKDGLYEFEITHAPPHKDFGPPWWNGEDLSGKTVILAHEQGFGDTLHFIRFAPMLKARCARLIFSGPESLAPLIAEQFDCFDDVINNVGPFEADYITTPLVSAALMGIDYKDVDGQPYMNVEPIELPPRGKLKVGISWRGNPSFLHDGLRSATLQEFSALFDVAGAAFYSLQVRPGPDEITTLGLDGFIADLGSTFNDWRDTARAIAAMDVVVTTDSANGHMAGALGKPVLLILGKNPDWRWMKANRTKWYKNTKIYRQENVDQWPMLQVRSELARLVNLQTSRLAQAS